MTRSNSTACPNSEAKPAPSRPSRPVWVHAALDHKLRVQDAIYPEGPVWTHSGFGTAAPALAFRTLQSPGAPEFGMVAVRGFEPRSDG